MAERGAHIEYFEEVEIRDGGTGTKYRVTLAATDAAKVRSDPEFAAQVLWWTKSTFEGSQSTTQVASTTRVASTTQVAPTQVTTGHRHTDMYEDSDLSSQSTSQVAPTQVTTGLGHTEMYEDSDLSSQSTTQVASTTRVASTTQVAPTQVTTGHRHTEMYEDSDLSDMEETSKDEQSQNYTFWSRKAVLLLLDTYKQHEIEMDDPKKKKKEVWEAITKQMNAAGYHFSQNKIECKWRNMLLSHKEVKDNKKQTGGKRKSYQYYAEMDEIVAKRHDIDPPYTSGSSTEKTHKKKFLGKGVCTVASSPGDVQTKHQKKKSSDDNEILEFLKTLEKNRQKDHDERERRRDERATERNAILRDFLKKF